ncbi:MAG TPA: class I SAM-dependent methyltransferase [Bacillota bacterium]|nr:class I SAM-dependent methyltransferase [Bacillota bacterium]
MKQSRNALERPEFWQQAWEEARRSSVYMKRRIRSSKEAIEFWNKCAPDYGKNTSNETGHFSKIMELFRQEQIITPETKVLDVGCGPGTYALPFAKEVKSVTALDGAIEMCRILEQKVEELGLDNIQVIHRLWEELDIEREGLAEKFDLVFASMTPAVSDFETLDKLNQASSKYCCLITRAGGNFGHERKELWKLLFNEEDTGSGHESNIIFPFNLLFCAGYYPTIRYLDFESVREQSLEEAIDSLCRSFWLYTEITPEVSSTITRYVQENAVGNVYRQESKSRLGVMVWRVDERRNH